MLQEANQNVLVPGGDAFGVSPLVVPVPRYKDHMTILNLAVTTETTLRLSSPQRPCFGEEKPNNTFKHCVDNVFESKHGCILPWRLSDGVNTTDVKFCCETQLAHYGKHFTKILGLATFEKLYQETGCIFSCNQTVSNEYSKIKLFYFLKILCSPKISDILIKKVYGRDSADDILWLHSGY